ncbi:MAG: T9SS type A sorting domain-containing protein [Bacteroidetes bacterium]|nr:T9SS type A sorting domain-containing protein [Bacteroidota bacterium]
MRKTTIIICLLAAALTGSSGAQHITLQPQAGQMACAVRVPGFERQSFILGLPETIGSSEGMILNFPEVSIEWEGSGAGSTQRSRFYFANGSLQDFITRYEEEVKVAESPRVAMCWGGPWALADTAAWPEVLGRLDILKIYIGDINERVDPETARTLLTALHSHDVKIAIELGGLLDWHADEGERSAETSFQQEWASVQPLIRFIRQIDSSRSIDMLDMDGPIRRMLLPNNVPATHHTLESAVDELSQVVQLWRDSIPGIEINLLTNFPNWAWGNTPAYFAIAGNANGYGRYEDVLDAIEQEGRESGLFFDALTVDNPYDYATGIAQTNHPSVIAGVDWMQRLAELDARAAGMGWKVNMIFNTNGARTAEQYSRQTLQLIDLYHDRVGRPDGYWIQSWYQLPDAWLPETGAYTMTHITREAMRSIEPAAPDTARALLEPDDGRVYHGVQTMTFVPAPDPLAGYLSVLDERTQPAVRGMFFSVPGTRGPDLALRQLGEFFRQADSVGFIPELSLFLVSDVATDSIIAVSVQYDVIIDSIITLAREYGRAMFLRIGGEFNGAGADWNGGGYHPHLYVTMFRKITDMFAARGFRDSIATIWCYMPAAANDFDSVDVRGALWYPGDEYVDWFGLDVFDEANFDQSLPDYDRRGITTKGKSERFLAMARLKGKPVYMSETSAIRRGLTAGETDSRADWDAWFAKFWEFIGAHPEIKGFSYIDANWPEHAYPGWGDARIENSPFISAKYLEEMRKPRYIHLPWTPATGVRNPLPVTTDVILHQNYPNPFNASTVIALTLARTAQARVEILDMLGRPVRVLADEVLSAGTFHLPWDGRHAAGHVLPSGIYFARVRTGQGTRIRTMIMLP